jgi:acetyl-CoA carboxylase carboxyltransferase component
VVDNLARVPVVGMGLGSVAGLGAARLVSTHYSVMVKDISYMFIAGPPIVAKTGRVLTKDELGGVAVHAAAGSVDDVADSEQDAFARVRRFLSYLPSSIHSLAERVKPTDDPDRRDEMLLSIVPRERRKTYDMRKIIKSVVDRETFFEMGRAYGKSVITGLARIDGYSVAVLASNPNFYGGCWTADAARKVERFVDLANTFHVPVIHLVDIPGFLIGPESEAAGTIRHGARAQAAVYQAKIPWCSIIVRKCFGVAGSAHSNHTRLRFRYAWPSADWGSLPIEGGIDAAYRAELEASDDPERTHKEIEDRLNAIRTPFRSAEAFLIEEMIDPRDTRPLLCEFARLASAVLEPGPVANGMRP